MSGTTIAAALDGIRERIDAALRRAGRAPGSARLIAVSKTVPAEAIHEALRAGQREFGESYGQELRDKLQQLTGEPRPVWHYIGPLQSNKVKYVAGRVALVHSVGSASILDDIDRHVAKLIAGGQVPPDTVQACLVQVNVAGETQKHGVEPAALGALLDAFGRLEYVRCRGLMLIPPLEDDPGRSRPLFTELRRIAAAEAAAPRPHVELLELSMGMSDDFEIAVEEGATLVRVGSAIFGSR